MSLCLFERTLPLVSPHRLTDCDDAEQLGEVLSFSGSLIPRNRHFPSSPPNLSGVAEALATKARSSS